MRTFYLTIGQILILTAGVAFCEDFSGPADNEPPATQPEKKHSDAFRAEDIKLEKRFFDILDRCIKEKPDYKISELVKKTGRGMRSTTIYSYEVTLPDFMTKGITALTSEEQYHELGLLLFKKGAQDKKRSFYVQLIGMELKPVQLGESNKERPFYSLKNLYPIVKKDVNLWQRDYEKQGFSFLFGGGNEEIDIWYRNSLFWRALSPSTQKQLQDGSRGSARMYIVQTPYDSIKEYHYVMASERRKKTSQTTKNTDFMLGQAIEVYREEKKSTSLLVALPTDAKTMVEWARTLLAVEDKELPSVISAFCIYADGHKNDPVFGEYATGLFLSRGYSFDEKTGRYDINPIGKAALACAVKNPNGPILRVLDVLMTHGNKELILDLLVKHQPEVKGLEGFRTLAQAAAKKGGGIMPIASGPPTPARKTIYRGKR